MYLTIKLKWSDIYIYWAAAIFLYVHLIGFSPFPEVNYGRDVTDTGGGNRLRQIIFLGLFLYTIMMLGVSKLPKFNFLLQNKTLVLLAFWFLLSSFWSDEPGITIRRSVFFLIVCFIPIVLCSIVGFRRFIKINAYILSFFIVFSIVCSLIFSGAVHHGEVFDTALNGAWRGLFSHKNNAAIIASISGFIFLYQYFEENKKFWLFMFLLTLLFLLLTKSKTSIALFLPVVFFTWRLSKGRFIKYFCSFIFALSLVTPLLFLFSFAQLNYFLIENPEMFTGRSAIWQVLLEAISGNYILGLGYGAVWSAGEYSAITNFGLNTSSWVSSISHGHNGYLDIWLSTGIVGLLLFTFLLFKALKNIADVYDISNNEKFMCLSIIFFLVLHNFLESSFTVYYSPGWYFFLLTYCLKFKKKASN